MQDVILLTKSNAQLTVRSEQLTVHSAQLTLRSQLYGLTISG